MDKWSLVIGVNGKIVIDAGYLGSMVGGQWLNSKMQGCRNSGCKITVVWGKSERVIASYIMKRLEGMKKS